MAFPGGTVTFLFTDIEGSTALLQRLGDDYTQVVADHRRLLRDVFQRADGREVDTQGDAFFYSFTRAREAVRAAVDGQRALAGHSWPQGAEVRVRMGLHTGEPTVGDEGYVGLDVVRAARICSAGHGGQILLSETTRALVGNQLPEGVSVRDLGRQHLKDIQHEHVYELSLDEEHRVAGRVARPRVDAERRDAEVVPDRPPGAAAVAQLLDLVEVCDCVVHRASSGLWFVRRAATRRCVPKVVRRRGVVRVICSTPKHKQRQG